jgi:hypothetical protein
LEVGYWNFFPVSKRHNATLRAQATNIPGLGMDVPELKRARALWQLNRFDEAIDLFELAVRKYPQNLVALVDASRALGARFEINRAEMMLDRLMKLAASNPKLLHLAGQSYRMIFRPDKAIACFERVVAMTKDIPDAQLELAVLYERRHRLNEAYSLIESCLRADPGYFEAEFFRAGLLRRLKDEVAAQTVLRELASNQDADPLVRAQAFAANAQIQDRQADYDAAMSSMLDCKNILMSAEGPLLKESETLQGHLRRLADSLTRDHFQRWVEAGRQFPQRKMAVLAGFPRTGTTLLEQVLDSHPGLVSSDEREAFGRDIFPSLWLTEKTPIPTAEALDSVPAERLERQRARYLDYISAALNQAMEDRVHLDKNPTMTLLLPGMLRLFPETKLIIALRDPRDVVVSCFMQYLPLNPNSVCFLTLERTARRYAHDMSVWLKLREIIATPWIEVRYENCVADLECEARKALDFLGLPWDPKVLQYRERLKSKSVSSPTYEAVTRPLYTSAIGRWKHYEKYLEPCLPILEPFIQAFRYQQ